MEKMFVRNAREQLLGDLLQGVLRVLLGGVVDQDMKAPEDPHRPRH
jgi:hypothetical protein